MHITLLVAPVACRQSSELLTAAALTALMAATSAAALLMAAVLTALLVLSLTAVLLAVAVHVGGGAANGNGVLTRVAGGGPRPAAVRRRRQCW